MTDDRKTGMDAAIAMTMAARNSTDDVELARLVQMELNDLSPEAVTICVSALVSVIADLYHPQDE